MATAVGATLRLHAIGDVPPGLYQDEAYNGLDALGVLQGAHPIYFPANNGREPLYIYLTALSVATLGRTPAAVRLPAAFVGILTIPATYALGRALFGRRAGLLAAAICSVTFWPIALSRIGLRAGTLPLLAALSLACAAGGWRRRQTRWLILGGALYGLSFYTYLAARFTPLALSIFLIFWYIATHTSRPNARRGGRRDTTVPAAKRSGMPRLYGAAAFAVPALAVAAPLALFAAGRPEVFLGRADQVSILAPGVNGGDLWGTLFHNSTAALGMFLWRGDSISRHNLPGRPVFDPWMGAAFVVGVGLCLWRALERRRDPAAALALIWTGVMLAPTVLADDAPHFLRATGVLPMAFLFPAVALEQAWDSRFSPKYRLAGRLAVGGALIASVGLTVRDYFGRYAADPNTGYLFQSAAAALAREANRTTALGWTGGMAVEPKGEIPGQVYVDRRLWDNFPSLRLLVPASDRLYVIDGGQPVDFTPGETATVFLWPYEDMRSVLGSFPPDSVITPLAGPLAKGDLEPEPYSLYSEYRLQPLPPAQVEAWAPWAGFDKGLALHSRAAVQGNEVVLSLAWLAGEALDKDYQVFVHGLVGEAIIAQADGPLGLGLYPSSWWRATQVVEETRRLELPAGIGPGDVTLRVGLYDPATGLRLRRTDAPGDTLVVAVENLPGQ